MKKLPIGIQTFKKLRDENCIYIDKTKEAYELIESYTYSFLSRPRRFGKSLFLDTLRNIFEGNKELFEGLYIYDKWDWDTTYPVITISWDGNVQTSKDLNKKALATLRHNQENLGIECQEKESVSICFEELIKKAYQKYNQKVVILIDEYDRAILDTIDNLEQSKYNREFIKGMYSVMKGADQYIKFAFLTGVSKFSKASIFSGLNMLTDISLQKRFGNICGYTQNDIESSFKEYLDDVDLDKLALWYNGYNFLKDPVYNPFDILQFLGYDKKYKNYWFATGTPTFLIKLIEKNNYFLPRLSNIVVGEELLDSFDIEDIKLEVILYQSGYLTIDYMEIDEDDDIIYTLKIPNLEVRKSFYKFIVNTLYKDTSLKNKQLSKALRRGDLENFKTSLVSIFASIPYHNFTNNNMANYEGFYATVVYTYLSSLGLEVIGEDVTNHGRIDITVKIENYIYIIELKVTDDKPLEQIKTKKYYEKYISENKEIFLVGISFDKQDRNISKFEWERWNPELVQGK
jgi:hypothetical protein